jgi:hypothetical protein
MGRAVIKGAQVECEQCGVQRVMLDDLVLRIGVHTGSGAVRFRCAGCGLICLRPISAEQTESMAGTRIRVEWWEPPKESHEYASGAITEWSIREWTRLLADDDALGDVVSTLARDC